MMIEQTPRIIQENWHRFLVVGVAFVLGGILAILAPAATTVALKYILGATFLAVGALHSFQCFLIPRWDGFLWELLISAAFLLCGTLLLADPFSGLVGITVLIALTLMFEGILRVITSLRLRPDEGWVWLIASGITSFVIGLLIWNRLPSSAAIAIGFLVGFGLILSGFSYILLAARARRF